MKKMILAAIVVAGFVLISENQAEAQRPYHYPHRSNVGVRVGIHSSYGGVHFSTRSPYQVYNRHHRHHHHHRHHVQRYRYPAYPPRTVVRSYYYPAPVYRFPYNPYCY